MNSLSGNQGKTVTKILVVIDPDEEVHSALNRIKEMPPTSDVDYKVDLYFNVQPLIAANASSNSADVKALIEEKRTWLEDLVKPFQDLGYRITTELLVVKRLYEDIIKSAREFNADFVFKPLRQHGVLKRAFYTPTDWNLIRLCPTPLLLVSDQTNVRGRPIVAAVDLSDKDREHQELNTVVVEQAKVLARILDSDVHLVYAFVPAVVGSPAAVRDPMSYQVIRGKYDEEREAAIALGKKFGISEEHVHLRQGPTEYVLRAVVGDVNACVTVIGTVARSGASGLFIGNTAESVLERSETDVFVLKGSSFEAQV